MKTALKNILSTYGPQKTLVVTALAVIILANTAILARVAYNRSGTPETWTFTERELHSNRYRYNSEENSSLILHLDWQGTPPQKIEGTAFRVKRRNIKVDKAALEALEFPTEFNCENGDDRRYDRVSEKAWIALEYNGPTHRRYIETLENHLAETQARFSKDLTEERQRKFKSMRERLETVKNKDSRLYAVDVAPDRDTLEQRYVDSDIHLIQLATVMPWLHCEHPVEVYVADVLTDSIYVPKAHWQAFGEYDHWRRTGRDSRPGYEVEVAYGKLAEPWVLRGALKPDSPVQIE